MRWTRSISQAGRGHGVTVSIARDRFVRVSAGPDAKKAEVNWAVIERVRFCAGFKGYVTNTDTDTIDGAAVVAAYHDLWHVEESFRMTKSDLAARPTFHRKRDSIEAHLTVVFAALAVARYLQDRTGVSIKRLIHTLRPLRTVTITIAGQHVKARPRLDPDVTAILGQHHRSHGAPNPAQLVQLRSGDG